MTSTDRDSSITHLCAASESLAAALARSDDAGVRRAIETAMAAAERAVEACRAERAERLASRERRGIVHVGYWQGGVWHDGD